MLSVRVCVSARTEVRVSVRLGLRLGLAEWYV